MQLTHGSRSNKKVIRRVQIKPSDVVWPAFTLLHCNVWFLVAWTFSPFRLTWQRMFVNNFDILGRQVESYGACRPDDGTAWYLLFIIPLYLFNVLVLIKATHACYQGRNLPTEFSEARYLLAALISLSEISVMGGTLGVFCLLPIFSAWS
jgi:hypothetical protein